MLLTLTTTAENATDLGHLLHKHPGRAQAFDVSVGTAHVFYPEATPERCTVALLLEVDPVGLVRDRKGRASDGFALGQYVNDRPYAASSMLSVGLSRVFKTAMAGRCDARPQLARTALPLEIHVPALPCSGGEVLAARLFEPLGWSCTATPVPLDETIPAWGASRYVDLRLTGTVRLADALTHLYVLLPVLDDAKHYWVADDEVDKLVRAGAGWLGHHPDKALITTRYLAHQRGLTQSALARLAELDDDDVDRLEAVADRTADEPAGVAGETPAAAGDEADRGQPQPSLADQRRAAVLAVLREVAARRVADLGCGEGTLVAALLADPAFTAVVAADVSARALDVTARRLRLDELSDRQRTRVKLMQSSLTYRDARLAGLDAVVLMEVIEHIDPSRLGAVERTVFGAATPTTVIVTTPNAEHNVRFERLEAGAFRHRDHRFEWTRAEFAGWASRVGSEYGYDVRLQGVGPDDPEVGPPTQLAVFARSAGPDDARPLTAPIEVGPTGAPA